MGKHTVYRRQLRARVMTKYGAHCARCQFNDLRALELDHIEGGGKTERQTAKGIRHKYNSGRELWLLDALHTEGKYQILCANCNRIKQWERLEWAVPPSLEPPLMK